MTSPPTPHTSQGSSPGERAAVTTLQADLLADMKNARIQRTLDSFFQKTDDSRPSTSALQKFKRIIKILHTFLKFNPIHFCMYDVCKLFNKLLLNFSKCLRLFTLPPKNDFDFQSYDFKATSWHINTGLNTSTSVVSLTVAFLKNQLTTDIDCLL
jgi:hypothetical protein